MILHNEEIGHHHEKVLVIDEVPVYSHTYDRIELSDDYDVFPRGGRGYPYVLARAAESVREMLPQRRSQIVSCV